LARRSTTKAFARRIKPGAAAGLPTIAIVGRPNVGKSTLFNRLVGSRRALVGDEPGITRDRLYGIAHWRARELRIVDTGGIIQDEKEHIPAEIFRQAKVALAEAAAVVLVVDGRSELSSSDRDLARFLIRAGKPLFLAVNKVDTPELEPYVENYRVLGISNLYPISAEHGAGVAELLDAIFEVLPPIEPAEIAEDAHAAAQPEDEITESPEDGPDAADALDSDAKPAPEPREIRVAIIGRPNVGKSTLLNQLTGTSRAIVSPIPGTTRDAVDELVLRAGSELRFIDTAGIRRKGKTELMAEKLSVVMARKHLEAADVALLVIDASEGVTALDANIAGYAHESGRSLIIVINKWDLVIERAHAKNSDGSQKTQKTAAQRGQARAAMTARRMYLHPPDQPQYEEEVRRGLKFLNYAPVIFTTATKGRNVEKILEMVEFIASERRKRIGTGAMNRFLAKVDFERAAVPVAKRIHIFYMTQASTSPPTFILFTDKPMKLHFSYERFLENQLRDAFGFVGTPIRIIVRASKGKKGSR
jgi:GTP-binding protein